MGENVWRNRILILNRILNPDRILLPIFRLQQVFVPVGH